MRVRLLLIAMTLVVGSVRGDVIVSGEVSGTWTAARSPYVVVGYTSVPVSAALTIEPGTRIEFTGNWALEVFGVLNCVGTPEDSIFFTQDTIQYPVRWDGLRLYNETGNPCQLEYTVIEHGDTYDGSLRLAGTPMTVRRTTIRNCRGHSVVVAYFNYRLEECVIENGGNGGGCGGGIRAISAGLEVFDTRFEHNWALDGGALCLYDSDVLFERCLFLRNEANIWGGAIYSDSTTLLFRECVFDSNSALLGGAGLMHDDANTTFERCVFVRNTSNHNGTHGSYGVFQLTAGGTNTFTHCLFAENVGNVASVGNFLGTTVFDQCCFAHNNPLTILQGGVDDIRYCSFYPGLNVPQPPPDFGDLVGVNANGDSVDTFGNLTAVPLFSPNGHDGEFSHHFLSPLINAGNPAEGPDPDGTFPDIGPHTFHRLNQIEDLSIVRVGTSNDVRLRWSAVPEATEYWIFSFAGQEAAWDNAAFVGSTISTNYVHVDALGETEAIQTYAVVASQEEWPGFGTAAR
ncbi:MAG: right-handed parallel beta-helix repeat-containing protein [Calditrichaeota bacterium]|nr:right-handed parallel beta-helix repeat-containing protein [Calditrichota bacterium]MCB9391378.1 right-handed parallel beta-helix repeat-containing protein [Calditrichota bacterium]